MCNQDPRALTMNPRLLIFSSNGIDWDLSAPTLFRCHNFHSYDYLLSWPERYLILRKLFYKSQLFAVMNSELVQYSSELWTSSARTEVSVNEGLVKKLSVLDHLQNYRIFLCTNSTALPFAELKLFWWFEWVRKINGHTNRKLYPIKSLGVSMKF